MLVKVADWIADQYETLQRWVGERFDDDPRRADLVKNVIIVVCVVAVVTVVVTLISLIIAVLGAATAGAAQGLTVALERVADWHLTEVVTTPVRAYIIAHAAGLPAGAEAIWSAWTLSGAGLWLVCWLFRSWGHAWPGCCTAPPRSRWSTAPAPPAGGCSLPASPSCTGRCCPCSPSAASAEAAALRCTSIPALTSPPRYSSSARR